MKSFVRLTWFAIAIIITVLVVELYGQTVPNCRGAKEPSMSQTECGIGFPEPCVLKDGCQNPSHYGRNFDYCCHETIEGCLQIQGRHECCESGWAVECKVIANGNACENSSECI